MVFTHLSVAAGFATLAIGAPIQANERYSIPPGSAQKAIIEWSRQSHIDVLFESAAVKGVRTGSLAGTYPPLDALGALLVNTRLKYVVVSHDVVGVHDAVVVIPASRREG